MDDQNVYSYLNHIYKDGNDFDNHKCNELFKYIKEIIEQFWENGSGFEK